MKDTHWDTPCRSWQGLFCLSLCLGLIINSQPAFAANATAVKKLSEKAVQVGIASQQTHEAWVDEEHRLLEEIEALENQLDHIQWQRKKLAVYKSDLEEKIAGLEKKAEAMQAVNMKLLPILEKNLEHLHTVVDTDIPSNMTQRQKSLHQAAMVLNDYDMGLLDKTRAVLDAAAREVDLGHQVNVFEDEIEVEGELRRVQMLQVGRIGLYAMTLDSEKAYQWDNATSTWLTIEDETTSINEAIEMAEGIRLVGLSRLPVAQPEQLKGEGAQ